MPSKKQRAKAAKAAKKAQPPATQPPQPPKTLRQLARAADRAIRRAPPDTPVFLGEDDVMPRAMRTKPPPPQVQKIAPTWNGAKQVNTTKVAAAFVDQVVWELDGQECVVSLQDRD